MRAPSPFDQELVELLPTALYVCDSQKHIIQLNRRAEAIWGIAPDPGEPESQFYSRFRLLDSSGTAVVTPPLTQVLTYCAPRANWDLVLERQDRSRIFILVNATLLQDASGTENRAVALFQEISDLKRTEEALRVKQRVAAASRLASDVAQRLTDPLKSIALCASELQQDSTLSDTARQYALMVQKELARLGGIARQALTPYGARL